MIRVTESLAIDERRIEWSFVRAPGPGGQNVNKVASAALLRFDPAGLPEAVRARLAGLAGRRLAADGTVVIQARRFRTQERNRADALERLLALLRSAATPPRPRTATRVPRGERARRLEAKRRRAAVKSRRKAGPDER